MTDPRHDPLIASYRDVLGRHGDAAEAVKMSAAGQRFRFAALCGIGDLHGASVADVGCGLGDLYAFLHEHVGDLDYTGIDIVPEMVERAQQLYPEARFEHVDVVRDGLGDEHDYVLLSSVGNDAMDGATEYLRALVKACFAGARLSLGFNFISSHARHQEPELAYHDPAEMLDFCIRELTPHVRLHHYYGRADVVVFCDRA
jgi:SAM-dependent methyltransferase